jgi:cyclophilin family peptidyl-prolyl cis-trans isomerase/HEAT repeat protein
MFHVKQVAMAVTCCHAMALVACEPTPAPRRPDREPPVAVEELNPGDFIVDADRREASEGIRAGLDAPSPTVRAAAMLSVARIHSGELLPLLRRGLRDPSAPVRAAASFGIGALEDEAPDGVAAELAAALAAEEDTETRAQMIRDLGRLRSADGLPAVVASLRADSSEERAGGCRALGEYGLRNLPVPSSARTRAAALIGAEQPLSVRIPCAFALARLPAPTDPEAAQGELVALGLATGDADPDVRMYVYRALGNQPGVALDTLGRGTEDADWRPAAQAFRALALVARARERGPAVYAQALDAAFTRTAPELTGGNLQLLLVALEAAGPMARSGPIFDVAARIHRELGSGVATRDRGLAHCAAADLVDRGRGWPSRIESCGLEQVTADERAKQSAAIIGGIEGADPQRAALLRRLFRRGSPQVQQAVMSAAPSVWQADTTDLVLTALRSRDAGVITAAAEALAAIARRAPTETQVPPPVAAERTVAALRAARRNLAPHELEAIVTWLDAVEATDARDLGEVVGTLALHPNHAVRSKARTILRRWEREPPTGRIPPPENVIERDELLDGAERPRVRLITDRGEIVVELRPDVAPTTVARFLRLVRDGFYEGLTFHRVVPGFVVQGGDPRGDGYGGPPWSQRCEDNRMPYTRGTVGMALAGRDTGGSQFFITHSAQPHLEGRYTAFGQVVDGLDVIDLLQVGDHIRTAAVSE